MRSGSLGRAVRCGFAALAKKWECHYFAIERRKPAGLGPSTHSRTCPGLTKQRTQLRDARSGAGAAMRADCAFAMRAPVRADRFWHRSICALQSCGIGFEVAGMRAAAAGSQLRESAAGAS